MRLRYLHIQMMYFAAPWKSPVGEKISLLLANTHFISLLRALYLTAEFIHFLFASRFAAPLPPPSPPPRSSRQQQRFCAIIFAIRMSKVSSFACLLRGRLTWYTQNKELSELLSIYSPTAIIPTSYFSSSYYHKRTEMKPNQTKFFLFPSSSETVLFRN